MKLFTKVKPDKSWGLKLQDYCGDKSLIAVDMETEIFIATLVYFREEGDIDRALNAFGKLEDAGYDPHEHDNDFDDEGRWVIE